MEIRSLAAGNGKVVQLLKSRCSRNTKYKSVRCMLFLAAHLLHLLVSQLHFFFFFCWWLHSRSWKFIGAFIIWAHYDKVSSTQVLSPCGGLILHEFAAKFQSKLLFVLLKYARKNWTVTLSEHKTSLYHFSSIPPMSIFKYEGEGKLLAHFPLLSTTLQGHYLKSEKYLQNFLPFA